ncbi:MAG: GH3 auxin-responsive promoter family protein [Planctomycetota bacterium]|nr:GH3 auxin-responsive promoter family protein [Planctomycetota bacterium]
MLVRVRLRWQLARFMTATEDCRATQAQTLTSLLELNRTSDLAVSNGLEHATSPDDLRKALPVTDYSFYRDAIERAKLGETQSLLGPKNRLMMFTLSSGTTSESKFIPVTNRFYRDYRRSWQLWGISAFDARPKMKSLKIVQLSSDYQRFTTEGGAPCGNISGLSAVMQKPAVKLLYSLPSILAKIDDPAHKYYAALRLAVADPNVGMLTTANPSTLVHMAQVADDRKEELIRDIHNGTLSISESLAPDIRQALDKRISKADPNRARDLAKWAEQSGSLLPKDYWPNLQLAAVWTGGSCAAYLPTLVDYYGDVAVRDHGLSASEGRMTIPFDDNTPDGVLDITSHYYEFIPEAEYGSDTPTILQAHELDVGRNYFILLTTASGFYRYDICDVVRCVGHHNTTPILRFLHKGAYISNITGEKLSESQVVEAVRSTLTEFSHRVRCFTLIPSWGKPPRYQLMLEDWELPPNGRKSQFEARLDERLCELNCEYQEKRTTARLNPVEILPVRCGSWVAFARDRQAKLGGSIEQYKHPCLLPDLDLASAIADRFRVNGKDC